MDEWQFSQPYWDGSSEAQRRQPPRVSSTPAPGVLPSFGFPTDSGFLSIAATPSINLTDFGHPTPLLFPDLFPGASQPAFHSDFSLPASWDTAPFSMPAQFSQQPSENVYDPSVQPYWDDFVSSQRRLDPLPRVRGQEIFTMAMASISSWQISGNIPWSFLQPMCWPKPVMSTQARDFRPLRPPAFLMTTVGPPVGGHPAVHVRSRRRRPVSMTTPSKIGHPPSISVEIGPWDSAGRTSDDPSSEMFSVPEPDLDMVDEAPDMNARLGWEWKPSGMKWLDPEVSSEVVEFPNGTPLTDKQKIYVLHRVKGCPSQFPFYRRRTAFFIDLTDMEDLNHAYLPRKLREETEL
ncbi:hypothetical protein B0H14DRAFT_3735530 [Mycena olivaceomarginata]|nr:hypothetical protein B0H14DRAFT_3735530 [Mycena olivaceomarginata]